MTDGRHDFDFLVGTWTVHHTRLNERLVGCTKWSSFDGHSEGMMVLGGLGNFDQVTFRWVGEEVHGCTLRLFNPVTNDWTLNWSDSATGVLFPPQTGRFSGDTGSFYGMEPCNGQTVLTRFVWSGISPVTARWEQTFSADGGQNWESNWIMEFSKAVE